MILSSTTHHILKVTVRKKKPLLSTRNDVCINDGGQCAMEAERPIAQPTIVSGDLETTVTVAIESKLFQVHFILE